MIRFAADENFNNDILRGLRRRYPDLDIIRIQDTEVVTKADPAVLEWTAQAGRILLTHDVRTIPNYAYERVGAGLPMPGAFIVRDTATIGEAVEALSLILEASRAEEWKDKVIHLPWE